MSCLVIGGAAIKGDESRLCVVLVDVVVVVVVFVDVVDVVVVVVVFVDVVVVVRILLWWW